MNREAVVFEGLGIELRPFKPLGFHPACVVVGISSEGIVGPLVASHLIQQLTMDQVCALESPMFPPASMIYFQKPKFPARIYGSKRHRLAVILAEFAPMDEVVRPLTQAILAWADKERVERIFAIEAFAAEASRPQGVPVAAIGSTEIDRKAIAKARLSEVQHGALSGVAAVLLNEGRWQERPTIAFMTSVGEGAVDAEAAVAVLAAIKRLLPKLPLDIQPSADAPTRLEKAIRAAHQRQANYEFI